MGQYISTAYTGWSETAQSPKGKRQISEPEWAQDVYAQIDGARDRQRVNTIFEKRKGCGAHHKTG
jgi:hypothetical protein